MSDWLSIVAVVSLVSGVICAIVIAVDVIRHPQNMWIMNLVWPITGLYGSGLALWAYFSRGRQSHSGEMESLPGEGHGHSAREQKKEKSSWASYGLATTHCGSGCTLGDLIAEWAIFFFPVILTWFGYRTLFEHKIFAGWVLDFLVAFAIGIAFQYYTIAPMRNLSLRHGLVAAIKADTFSLLAWQIGMYGWMAIVVFRIFGRELSQTDPVFWFMMQIAMLCGFATSYPVNMLLVSSGIKEKM